MFPLNSSVKHHDLIGSPQIKLILPVSFVEQNFSLMPGKRFFKSIRHILAHLVTGLTDGRANRRIHILRICPEFFLHPDKRCLPHPRLRASPSGMAEPDRTVHRIHEIKRHTIRIKRCKNQSRLIGHKSIHICVRTFPRNSVSATRTIHTHYIRCVRLIRTDNIRLLFAKSSCNPAVILLYRIRIIPSGKTQIQAFKNAFAHTTLTCCESILNNPRLIKKREVQKRKHPSFPTVIFLQLKDLFLILSF